MVLRESPQFWVEVLPARLCPVGAAALEFIFGRSRAESELKVLKVHRRHGGEKQFLQEGRRVGSTVWLYNTSGARLNFALCYQR